jgi:hypothetical protein
VAKSVPADDETEKTAADANDDAYAANAIACARELVTWAQNALKELEDPGFRKPNPWGINPGGFRRRAEAARRAWIAVNVDTGEPSDAAWRDFIRETIRAASWLFDEGPTGTWPEDPEARALERGRREVRFAASLHQKIATVNPRFGDLLVGNEKVLFDAMRAHFNRGGAGKKAELTKQDALAKLDRVLKLRATGAARTARRRRSRRGGA